MKTLPPEVRDRLPDAIHLSRQALEFIRRERADMIRMTAGAHFAEGGSRYTQPVNMMALYQSVIGRALFPKDPRVMFSTHDHRRKPAVSAMEQWADEEIVRMKLGQTFQRIGIDALYSVGIAKIALATPCDSTVKAWRLKAGQPFIDRVDLEDFVYDMYARDFSEVSFIGHRYRCPLDVAMDLYRKSKKELEAADDEEPNYNEQGDDRIGRIARGEYSKGELARSIDLWEIWLPRYKVQVTMLGSASGGTMSDGDILGVQNWIGPDDGPYKTFGLELVPGAAMPKGPIQNIYDLSGALNRAWRKNIRSADRLKTTLPVAGGRVESGKALSDVSDGDIWECDDPGSLKEMVTGGPNPVLTLWVKDVRDIADQLAGNLSMLAGLAPQSKTASQDKMLNENSSRMIGDMQGTATCFAADCLKALGWFWWHHPEKVTRVSMTLPGLPDVGITRRTFPKGMPIPTNAATGGPMGHERQGPMPDIQVDPYSLVYSTPQSRLAFINGVVQQMTPMLPILQQQGVMFDAPAYLRIVAKYGNVDEITEVFKVQEPPEIESTTGGEKDGPSGLLPGNTTRSYERISKGNPETQQRAERTGEQMAAAAEAQADRG